MQALALVALTLAGLGGVLFGSDYLDRRIAGNPGPEGAVAPLDGVRPGGGRCPGPPRAAGSGVFVARPAPGCDHAVEAEPDVRPGRILHGRVAGPHGPIAVPAGRR